MTQAAITKTLKREELTDESMSLGFRRFFVLPNRVRKNIQLAHLLETGNIDCHNRIVSFFQAMTDKEYINYMKLA